MRLLIDAGNTRIKWVLLSDGEYIFAQADVQSTETHGSTSSALQKDISRAQEVYISNVAGEGWVLALDLSHARVTYLQAQRTFHGLVSRYDMPAQLGVDRWLSLLAVHTIKQAEGQFSYLVSQAVLVVSLGTAVTLDALVFGTQSNPSGGDNEETTFLGGSIMPGLRLLSQSLATETAQLPALGSLLEAQTQLATNTHHALMQGCVDAVVGAIVQQAMRLEQTVGVQPQLLLTGGDVMKIKQYLPIKLAQDAVFVDNLVLVGLASFCRHETQV